MKIGQIHSIEMVGDTVRTPIILDTIKKCFGKEVSKTYSEYAKEEPKCNCKSKKYAIYLGYSEM